jgi:MFS transporter, SP family, general alpha glucoside:H+ symporter
MEEQKSSGYVEDKLAALAPSLDGSTVGIDDDLFLKMAEEIPNFSETMGKAQNAFNFEHQLSNRDAFRLYPKAIAFSFILSLAIIMEGYDTALLGSFYAYPTFTRRFGRLASNGTYQVSSQWQSGLQNGTQVGQILGLMLAGVIADRYGYKKTMLGSLALVIAFIFLLFFADSIGMLFAGEILCGVPWGAFQTLTTTYAAEISPVVLRPYLTTYVNLCWITGQVISTGVLRGLLGRKDEWAWRIPYAIQWVWPVPIMIGVIFAPESPWWLVRKDKLDEARKSLARLCHVHKISSESNCELEDTIAFMVVTNTHERIVHSGVSYWDCFKGVDLRRTEVVCCVWIIQVFCGIWFGGSVVYFLQQVGFSSTQSFDFGLGVNAIGWLGTVASWLVMQHFGRRTLYVAGMAVMFLVLITVGFLGIPSGNSGLSYASAALMLLFVFTYDLTVGPVCYCLISEMPSTRLRIKSAVLARNCYNIASIIANFLNPPILNPTAWNLKGKGGFIWAAFCGLSFIWSYFRLPEPRGRTPAELDILFEQKIDARKFSEVKVNPFRSTSLTLVSDATVH